MILFISITSNTTDMQIIYKFLQYIHIFHNFAQINHKIVQHWSYSDPTLLYIHTEFSYNILRTRCRRSHQDRLFQVAPKQNPIFYCPSNAQYSQETFAIIFLTTLINVKVVNFDQFISQFSSTLNIYTSNFFFFF